ncbi:MAG: hypothetical protein KKF80_06655 [Candidatus Omnitrophica bacterium]|nr:hypothetical protein [Candidatus Omnitrophota bacterium]
MMLEALLVDRVDRTEVLRVFSEKFSPQQWAYDPDSNSMNTQTFHRHLGPPLSFKFSEDSRLKNILVNLCAKYG